MAGKKVVRKQKTPQEKFEFINQALNNREDYFRLSFSTELLLEVLNTVIDNAKVSRAEAERFAQTTNSKKTLKEIFEHFKVKQE